MAPVCVSSEGHRVTWAPGSWSTGHRGHSVSSLHRAGVARAHADVLFPHGIVAHRGVDSSGDRHVWLHTWGLSPCRGQCRPRDSHLRTVHGGLLKLMTLGQ
jgi:hypothetical protein